MVRSAAKVAWKDICLPKNEGGLCIPNIVTTNKALMTKHLWDLANKKDSLWVKWCHNYIIKDVCLWTCTYNQNAYWTWRKLLKLREVVQPFIKHSVGNGKSTFAWLDNWHKLGPPVKRFDV